MGQKDLFPRAARVGLGYVRAWLPDGRQEGAEWVALNPTRDDKRPGSFKVNLTTGSWADFYDPDARGNDVVSLYAYLHRGKLDARAREKGYKNIDGGIQAEAAREILETYDPTYFPSDDEKISIPKKRTTGDYWEGWTIVERGIDKPPELDTSWYAGKWGEHRDTWDFTSGGRIVMKVCRFVKGDKKNDRPFTVWTDGAKYRWRAKGLETYPLWNVDELTARPNDPVLIFEGQKAAAVLRDIVGDDYVVIGWYGGAGNAHKADWSAMIGREAWFPFDADVAGRKALTGMKKISEEHEIKLHPVHPPIGVPAKWDLADAVTEDGWTREQIINHLQDVTDTGEQSRFLDDDNRFKFRILGYSGDHIVFYPYGSRKIVKYKASSLSKSILLTLMERELWRQLYGGADDKIYWEGAIDDILREAERRPMFDSTIVRGTGAWMDNGELIVNTGEKLVIAGKQRELYETDGEFIYERGKPVPYCVEDAMSCEEASKLMQMVKLARWKSPIYADVFAGWMLLGPFGGALMWRPHIWITGPKGVGKTWLLEQVASIVIGDDFGVKGKGTGTPAGTRNALGNSSVCALMEEMESDNPKESENIEQNVKFYREGSSGYGRGFATLHGTPDGEGRQWFAQSMAMFASIGASLRHGADKDRFTILSLIGAERGETPEAMRNKFAELEKRVEILTRMWGRAFVSRTYEIFPEVQRAVNVMITQVTELAGNRRAGDQCGTLLAGAWMVTHDTAPTAAQAKEYLESNDVWCLFEDAEGKTDESLCLDEILSGKIEITDGTMRTRVTIGAALKYWYTMQQPLHEEQYDFPAADDKRIKYELEQTGIKPISRGGEPKIQVASGHPGIKKLLKDSPWSHIYEAMLGRLPFCSREIKGPSLFAGVSKRFIELDASEMFEEIPF